MKVVAKAFFRARLSVQARATWRSSLNFILHRLARSVRSSKEEAWSFRIVLQVDTDETYMYRNRE